MSINLLVMQTIQDPPKGISWSLYNGWLPDYHTIAEEREDLRIAGCWAHVRRRFDEAVKALPKASQKNVTCISCIKNKIQAIYREDNKLKGVRF